MPLTQDVYDPGGLLYPPDSAGIISLSLQSRTPCVSSLSRSTIALDSARPSRGARHGRAFVRCPILARNKGSFRPPMDQVRGGNRRIGYCLDAFLALTYPYRNHIGAAVFIENIEKLIIRTSAIYRHIPCINTVVVRSTGGCKRQIDIQSATVPRRD